MKTSLRLLDKISGCMYGGAIGDALGYPIEFYSYEAIQNKYGIRGIKSFHTDKNSGLAIVSDDTQMTIFTANGLLVCETTPNVSVEVDYGDWVYFVGKAYKEWLVTQEVKYNNRKEACNKNICWVYNQEELWNTRAPGNTCLNSLHKKELGSINKRINNSKGCGGVMRVAPVGLIIPKYNNDPKYIFKVGAEIAALTHGHIDGWAPAGFLDVLISRLVYTDDSLVDALQVSIETTKEVCSKYTDESLLIQKINQAYNLGITGKPGYTDEQLISEIGEGWTGEEALAIAIYCAVKYCSNFELAVSTAVNHSGDSDSTGAIAGNIVGAIQGYSSIPTQFKHSLECSDILEQLSLDIFINYDNYIKKYKS